MDVNKENHSFCAAFLCGIVLAMAYEKLCKDGKDHNWGRTLYYGCERTRCAKCGVDKPGEPLVWPRVKDTLSEDMNKMLDSLNVPKESDVPLGPGVP